MNVLETIFIVFLAVCSISTICVILAVWIDKIAYKIVNLLGDFWDVFADWFDNLFVEENKNGE